MVSQDDALDWAEGKDRWEEYQQLHGEESKEIPQDWKDQQLVQWVRQTRHGTKVVRCNRVDRCLSLPCSFFADTLRLCVFCFFRILVV